MIKKNSKELIKEVNEIKTYQMEGLNKEKKDYLIELWHISAILESGRYNRMLYTKTYFIKKYPEYEHKNKFIWFMIEDLIN